MGAFSKVQPQSIKMGANGALQSEVTYTIRTLQEMFGTRGIHALLVRNSTVEAKFSCVHI